MTRSARRPALRERREAGASIVELALIAPVMVLLVFGVLDLARAYQLSIRAENAAREGATYAQVRPNDIECDDVTDVWDRVDAEGGITTHPGFRLDVFGQDDSGGWTPIDPRCGSTVADVDERVRVEVTVTYDVMTPIVASVVGDTIDLTGTAEVRVQRR